MSVCEALVQLFVLDSQGTSSEEMLECKKRRKHRRKHPQDSKAPKVLTSDLLRTTFWWLWYQFELLPMDGI